MDKRITRFFRKLLLRVKLIFGISSGWFLCFHDAYAIIPYQRPERLFATKSFRINKSSKIAAITYHQAFVGFKEPASRRIGERGFLGAAIGFGV